MALLRGTLTTICLICIFAATSQPATAGEAWGSGYLYPARSDSLSLTRHHSATGKLFFLNGLWHVQRTGEKTAGRTLPVPGAYDFEGEVEFSRSFDLDSSFVDYRLRLVALGINRSCKIFVNGRFLGSHHAGHTPF